MSKDWLTSIENEVANKTKIVKKSLEKTKADVLLKKYLSNYRREVNLQKRSTSDFSKYSSHYKRAKDWQIKMNILSQGMGYTHSFTYTKDTRALVALKRNLNNKNFKTVSKPIKIKVYYEKLNKKTGELMLRHKWVETRQYKNVKVRVNNLTYSQFKRLRRVDKNVFNDSWLNNGTKIAPVEFFKYSKKSLRRMGFIPLAQGKEYGYINESLKIVRSVPPPIPEEDED